MTMQTHPQYTEMLWYWQLGNFSYEGDTSVKSAGTIFLSPTSGQLIDWTQKDSAGRNSYDAYKMRAVYPDLFKESVQASIGIMHKEPPVIELPSVLEPMRDNATLLGESLEMLLRRINARQLITGRLGLLGDIRADGDATRPVIVTYNEMSILNWDDTAIDQQDIDVRMVVLDESGYVMDASLNWVEKKRYRILALVDEEGNLDAAGRYKTAVVEDEINGIAGLNWEEPNMMGSNLGVIPFAFVNSRDLNPTPDMPPLDGLANHCMAIYRGEADYRQNLFMQGQDTLVRIGAMADDDEVVRTGAGARIDVPMGGDVKYAGVSSNGLPEQRQSLENDYNRAMQKAGQMTDSTSRAKESGEALRIRVAAQSATLPAIAMAGAAGLEKELKVLALWFGGNPDEVMVAPNLEFTNTEVNMDKYVKTQQARSLGLPLSEESVHNMLREDGVTEKEFEEEMAMIDSEVPAAL